MTSLTNLLSQFVRTNSLIRQIYTIHFILLSIFPPCFTNGFYWSLWDFRWVKKNKIEITLAVDLILNVFFAVWIWTLFKIDQHKKWKQKQVTNSNHFLQMFSWRQSIQMCSEIIMTVMMMKAEQQKVNQSRDRAVYRLCISGRRSHICWWLGQEETCRVRRG